MDAFRRADRGRAAATRERGSLDRVRNIVGWLTAFREVDCMLSRALLLCSILLPIKFEAPFNSFRNLSPDVSILF